MRFVFNRRTVEDQVVLVEASTYAEALKKARNGECFDTEDTEIKELTIRHLPERTPW